MGLFREIHAPAPPLAHIAGVRAEARIVFVGEAWGQHEDELKTPFVGSSGIEFTKMMFEAFGGTSSPEAQQAARECEKRFNFGDMWVPHRQRWLELMGFALTNVLALRPPGNDMGALVVSRKEVPEDYPYGMPQVSHGWLKGEFLGELARLRAELEVLRPNLVVALGATATWAMLQATNIGSIRGSCAQAHMHICAGEPRLKLKVLPTYHPAAVMRQWKWRITVIADFLKAARECEFPEIRRPKRQILVEPTLSEVRAWVWGTLARPPKELGVDSETLGGQIEMLSFARTPQDALVVPFIRKGRGEGLNRNSYWGTLQEELFALELCVELLESPIPKVFQNGMYDLQYLSKYGIFPRALEHDTMLCHHAAYPEMQKGLGFMGSIYTDEASWKLMRASRADTEKRDE